MRWTACCFLLLLAACSSSPTAAPAPTPAPTATPIASPSPSPGPVVLRSATFQSANGYTVNGRARIVMAGSSFALELLDDFRSSGSGALDVRLCATTSCGASDLNLGPIQGFTGRQSYALANDASAYRFAVIWCRAVNLPFGYGELR